MNIEENIDLERRSSVHAALGDPARLRIVDALLIGDASPSELATLLETPSNLLAHHLNVLEQVGLVTRRRSEGDGRRTYVRLAANAFDGLLPPRLRTPGRVVFVCTANSARSQLAAALWHRASDIPAASAGTHPGRRIDPGAIDAAHRHNLELRALKPRHMDDVMVDGDLVVTVCDLAHEELGTAAAVHWSVPDPARVGTAASFDVAFAEIESRVGELSNRLSSTLPS